MMTKPPAMGTTAKSSRYRCAALLRPVVIMAAIGLMAVPQLIAPALAQSQGDIDQPIPVGVGILNAVAYQTIAAGSGFDTVVRETTSVGGSELDNAVLNRVTQELVARGYHVDHEAPLVMVVGGDLVRGTSKDAMIDEIKGITPHHDIPQGNVFSTNGKTLLTKPETDTHPNTFRISVSVYDRKTGIYVWRGLIDRGTSNLTPDQATDHMVPPLVAAIGKSEQNRNVSIGVSQ
jgi:hypothetical protein